MNFARYLPRFGWEPYVLTLKDRHIGKVDPNRLGYVEGMKITKAGRLPTLSDAYLEFKKLVQHVIRRPNAPAGQSQFRPLSNGGSPSETVAGRLRRYFLSFSTLPDPERNWMWPAVFKALRVIWREKIDVILTSGPPYSVHLIGLLVKYITGVRWIADFRDPWMTTSSKSLYPTCTASLKIERWLERCVLGKADLVVANTLKLKEAFRNAHNTWLPERFVCISNGFDREFFSKFAKLEKDNAFTIIYTGTLYFGRTPEPVFQAIHELVREECIAPEAIRVRLVGECQLIGGIPIGQIIDRYQLTDVVEVLKPVSYVDAIEMVRRSHLALLLAPNQPYQIPAKIYDYMGTGTKVLALAEDGATGDLIRATGIGEVFSPTDVAGIKKFICNSFKACTNSGVGSGAGVVDQFDINAITQHLVEYLDRICITGEGDARDQRPRSYSR